MAGKQNLAHVVFFALKDRSPAAIDAFLDACRQFLSGHPGTRYFSVGARDEAYVRPVNDQQFDVALVVIFASKADHDRYQESPRHKQFLAEHSARWSQVRVFDALVSGDSAIGTRQ